MAKTTLNDFGDAAGGRQEGIEVRVKPTLPTDVQRCARNELRDVVVAAFRRRHRRNHFGVVKPSAIQLEVDTGPQFLVHHATMPSPHPQS